MQALHASLLNTTIIIPPIITVTYSQQIYFLYERGFSRTTAWEKAYTD
jgi:hypothetical protein